MIRIRKAVERGYADHGWLQTSHSFSFAGYHDPDQMGFRSLRVINDDLIQPGMGFGTHGHENMEIVTYVFEGALEHKDSTGTGSVLRVGDVQRMSAGSGVTHSEFNHSGTEPLRLLQIWLLPARDGIDPDYEEKHFEAADKRGALRLIVAPDGADGALRIHQDVRIYASILERGDSVEHRLLPGRHAWIQIIRGSLSLNGEELSGGDGAAISDEIRLRLQGNDEVELLLFDLN